ncbi:unnamed protein product [Calicophoron daubneyi]|uniref:PPPDE domain-containing protein n=1 Tax=Calicophoron daubneyi TaxID=300641 RepID=A0AAV2TIT9_CALDB
MQPSHGILNRLKIKLDRTNGKGRKSKEALSCCEPTGTMVTVNVYDMLWLNVYTSSFGVGVYHTGVVVYGTEYCYGGHPLNYSGIFAMVPQDSETLGQNYSYKTTLFMGRTDFTDSDVALILEDMGPQYRGDQYHLLHRNCNHFSDAFVQILCGASLPKWINRLATVGAKIPFIERSIPKMWLTPRQPEEVDLRSTGEMETSCTGLNSCAMLAHNKPHRLSLFKKRRSLNVPTRYDQSEAEKFVSRSWLRLSQGQAVLSTLGEPYPESGNTASPGSSQNQLNGGLCDTFHGDSSRQSQTSRSSFLSRDTDEENMESRSHNSNLIRRMFCPVPLDDLTTKRDSAFTPSGCSLASSASSHNGPFVFPTSMHVLPTEIGASATRPIVSIPSAGHSLVSARPPECISPELTTSTHPNLADITNRPPKPMDSPSSSNSPSCVGALKSGLICRLQNLCGSARATASIQVSPATINQTRCNDTVR